MGVILSDWGEQIATEVILIIALGTAVLGVAWKAYRLLGRIMDTLGVDDQGRTVSERLRAVEQMLIPDAGEPLKMQVERLEKDVDELGTTIRRLGAEITSLSRQLKAVTSAMQVERDERRGL